ncbi:MAG: hypothetical protein Q9211_001344 [Gyalolechia sp. 1 TL-2023]
MEGIVALGLVANIIQLVDATVKAFNICNEIYSLGASIDDSRMAITTTELNKAYDNLKDSLNRNTNTGHTILRSGVDLTELSFRCCETATALNNELQPWNNLSGAGFRKTLSKVVLKARKAKKLEQLKRSLDEYQKALDSKLLIDIRHVI